MSNFTPKIKAIISAMKKYKTFFIAVHQHPDGDTLGAALCTASILKQMKKKVYVFSTDKIPDNLKFMPFINWVNAKKLPTKGKIFDVCLLFECSTLKRAGDISSIAAKSKKIINIDHHKTHSDYGDINYIDKNTSSTSEIIFKIIEKMPIKLTVRQAECLYIGIVTDTGRFYYASLTPTTFRTAAKLIELGVKHHKINDIIYGTKALASLKLTAKALESLKVIDNQFAIMHLTGEDFKSSKALAEHTEDISNLAIMIPNVRVSALIKEFDNIIAVNLRSKGCLDVSEIAKSFGGGGHKNAAGFKTKMSFREIEKRIVNEMKKLKPPIKKCRPAK